MALFLMSLYQVKQKYYVTTVSRKDNLLLEQDYSASQANCIK